MMQAQGRITIRGAGMHPYVWGRARLSVWVVSVGGGVAALVLELWLQPFPVVTSAIVIFICSGVVWGIGAVMTKRNPFFPEIAAAAAWRWVRRARFLNS